MHTTSNRPVCLILRMGSLPGTHRVCTLPPHALRGCTIKEADGGTNESMRHGDSLCCMCRQHLIFFSTHGSADCCVISSDVCMYVCIRCALTCSHGEAQRPHPVYHPVLEYKVRRTMLLKCVSVDPWISGCLRACCWCSNSQSRETNSRRAPRGPAERYVTTPRLIRLRLPPKDNCIHFNFYNWTLRALGSRRTRVARPHQSACAPSVGTACAPPQEPCA
jgi:hypothetical protein